MQPNQFSTQESTDVLRKRWLGSYDAIQKKADIKIRSLLIASATDVQARINALASSPMFSAGVRTAQLRAVMKEVQIVTKEIFDGTAKIITDYDKAAAKSAVTAFTVTDRQFLEAAFRDSGAVASYISSQEHSAQLGVFNAISRITKSDLPLSKRVYRSQALANTWVKTQVNLGLIRNASAQEIAKTVQSSIRPNVAGGVSYAAMRLGRTEINNAFHATSISLAQDRPWVTGMSWHLSRTHIATKVDHNPEICQVYAAQTFTTENVPPKPHPQCRCYVAPQVEEMSTFLAHLTAGQYKGWMENAA